MRIPLKADVPGAWLWDLRARPRRPRLPGDSRHHARWREWWLEASSVAAVAVIVVICAAGAWTAPLLLAPLLAVPPALAGIGATTPRRPLAYGGAALVAAIIVAITATGATRGLPAATIVTVVIVTAVSALGAGLSRTSQAATTQQHLANVVSVAEAAQRAVLRPLPEHVGPLELGVVYLAAAADAQVGGDLYDVARTPHGIRLVIGDVRGKGLGAVEVAADVLGMYREVAHEVHTLPELARRLDAGLARRWGEHEEFVTALFAEISPEAGRLTLFNCGHPPPMLISADGGGVTVLEVPAPAPPLGLLTLGDPSGASLSVSLKPRDQLLLYTDGVTEARDAAREFYPLGDRLAPLASLAGASGDDGDLLELLRADLLKHVGAPLDDDAALVLVRAPAAWQNPMRGGARAITA
jgi:serine phosphatase RsbU (regulator of sigma subunit)